MPVQTDLDQTLTRLAEFKPTPFPVISLYLNAQADQHGRDCFEPFVRKQLRSRAKLFEDRSEERASFDKDVERLTAYLQAVEPSANAIALFACAGEEGFFDAVQLNTPLLHHEIYVQNQPHLFTLASLNDRFTRYAAVNADTKSARIFVFSLGHLVESEKVNNPAISRTQVGGWSQARYQRHIDVLHQRHAQEIVEALQNIVDRDDIRHIFLLGDEVIVSILRDQLPNPLAERVRDVLRVGISAPEREVFERTLRAMSRQDSREDAARVQELIDEYRSGGLAVVGMHDTLGALLKGQVSEVLICSNMQAVAKDEEPDESILASLDYDLPLAGGSLSAQEEWHLKIANALVTQARQFGAIVRFIEDVELLERLGGVGAFLRYRA